jgi:hypothetical protein
MSEPKFIETVFGEPLGDFYSYITVHIMDIGVEKIIRRSYAVMVYSPDRSINIDCETKKRETVEKLRHEIYQYILNNPKFAQSPGFSSWLQCYKDGTLTDKIVEED